MRHIFFVLAMFFAQLTFAQLKNDECSGAFLLTPSPICVPVTGDLQGASVTTVTTSCPVYRDVFYKFVATSSSASIKATPHSGTDMIISLFDDCGGAALTCIDEGGNGFAETITSTTLTVGTTYYVKIGIKTTIPSSNSFSVCLISSPNDECASARAITPGATCSFTSGSLENALTSSITTSCSGNNDVFYKFVATETSVKIRAVPVSGDLDLVFSTFEDCAGTALNCVDGNGAGAEENIVMTGLVIGKTYTVKVSSKTLNPTGKAFNICIQNVPANDACANATELTPALTCTPVTGSVDVATPSSMASSCNADKDVFYKFVATSAFPIIKVVPVSGLDVVVELLTTCGGTSSVCANAQSVGGTETLALSNLVIGNTYYIKVANVTSTPSLGTFTICIQNPPANDLCADATNLTGSTSCTTVSGTLNLASTSSLSSVCSGYRDVFYKFTASLPNATITVAPVAGLDATVSVFAGCSDNSALYCVNNSAAGVAENVSLSNLTPGTVYYIKVASVVAEPSAFTFTICLKNPPAYDECAGALSVTPYAGYFPMTGNLKDANTTPYLTACGGYNDVFYKFTASATTSTITVLPSAGLDATIGVFASCSATTPISCSNTAGDGAAEILRLSNLTIGNVYYIKVASVVASPTITAFSIAVQNPPANDQCAGAVSLNVSSTCSPYNTTLANATNSSLQSSCPLYNDVFYSFTATTSGSLITVVPSAGLDVVVSLYNACDGTQLTCVNAGAANIQEVLTAGKLIVGSTYIIQVGSAVQQPTVATFTICVESRTNDEKEFARVLATCDNNIILDNGTKSAGKMPCDNSTDPMFNFSHDLWFTFVATSTKYNINASRPISNSYGVELQTESGVSLLCERGSIKGGSSPAATVVASISTLTVGNTYYIRMGKDDLGPGNEVFSLCATPVIVPVPPVNDLCSSPTALTVGSAAISGTLVNAVSSTTSTTCKAYNDVFYSFTATSESADINIVPVSNLDAVVSLFTSCGSTLVKCANTSATGVKETLTLDALVNGQQYIVQVGNANAAPNSGEAPTFTIAVENKITTDLQENMYELNNVHVFPNPASGSVTVKTPYKGIQKLEMFSYNGDRVLQQEFDDSEYLLNVESIPTGVYLLLISGSNGNQQTQKISIVK